MYLLFRIDTYLEYFVNLVQFSHILSNIGLIYSTMTDSDDAAKSLKSEIEIFSSCDQSGFPSQYFLRCKS